MPSSIQAADDRLFHRINGLAGHSSMADRMMTAVATYSPELFAAALVALWLTWKPPNQRAGVLAGASALLALGIGQLVGFAFPRLRPYESGPATLLIHHSPDTSFPSDHATLAFAVAVAVWCFDRRAGLLLLAFSCWVAVARVYVGAHYPTDVVGGAVLGGATSLVVLWSAGRPPVAPALRWLFGQLRRVHLAAIDQPEVRQ